MSMNQSFKTVAANSYSAILNFQVAAEMVGGRLANARRRNIAARRYETVPNTPRMSHFYRLVENSTKSTSNQRSPCYRYGQ